MRIIKVFCLVAGGVAAAGPAFSASDAEWKVCNAASAASIDRPLPASSPILVSTIAGCTKIIDRKSEKAEDRSAAYNNRGDAYQGKGDYDHAIADYTDMIRLTPQVVVAYYARGAAYNLKGDSERSIADYTTAIALDPNDSRGVIGRGEAFVNKGDYEHAIADYGEAVRLLPQSSGVHRALGLAYLYGGNLPKALTEVSRAAELGPKDAYAALWLDIVARRSKVPSHLADAVAKLDMKQWPGPVVSMFLERTTPAAALAAADDPVPETKKGQICEANFYSGELALRQDSKAEAIRLMGLAANGCPRDFLERAFATAELKALGATH